MFFKGFKSVLKMALGMAAAVVALPLLAVNLLNNGDFSKIEANQLPSGWNLGADKHVNVTETVVPGAGYQGSNALQIINKSSYGAAMAPLRQFRPLIPGRQYELSCWSRGNAGGYLSFALGKRWGKRVWIRGGKDWTRYVGTFTCDQADFARSGAYEICLLSEEHCDVKVADLCLAPLNTLVNMAANVSREDHLAIIPKAVFNVQATSIPSGLAMLRPGLAETTLQCSSQGALIKSAQDLSAEAGLGYDDTGLIIYVRVHDDKHYATGGENMWNGDCVQIAIDQQGDRHDNRNATDQEIGLALIEGKSNNYCWTANRALNPQELSYRVTPMPDGYFVAARIAWRFLNAVDAQKRGAFSFNIAVNDTDDGVNRRAISLAPGICITKDNKYNTVGLLAERSAPVFFLPENKVLTNTFNALVVVNDGAPDYKLVLKFADGTTRTQPLPYDVAPKAGVPAVGVIKLESNSFPAGQIMAQIVSGTTVKAEASLEKKEFYNKFQTELSTVKAHYAALMAKCKVLPCPAVRLQAGMKITERQIKLMENDCKDATSQERKDYYGERNLRVCAELKELLAIMDKEAAGEGKEEYKYVSSPLTLKDGYFEATMVDDNGKKVQRPIIFSGYGHFGQVIRDLEWFQGINANAIQTEIGPDRVIVGENPDGTFIFSNEEINKKKQAVKRAWDNNVVIFFLMSPHYYPEWALTKHPEAAWNSGSFLRFDVQHPYARKLLEEYYRKVLTELRNSPGAGAVHSICISNEPKYMPSLRRPFTRERFINYLKQHYGNIGKLNATYGTGYASFEEAVPKADPTRDSQLRGLYYDFAVFRLDEFADWHAWMAKLVEKYWPGMPVHVKQLSGFGMRYNTEYERFSKFSTVHGTDCNDKHVAALMTSFGKPVHIVNSETHLSDDRDESPISYNTFYAGMFQQFMHGVGGATLWVWEDHGYDLFKKRHDFVGSIYRRPMGIMAIHDAAADANRLVLEIREAFLVKPQIALLYSLPSEIHSATYEGTSKQVYQATCYAGRKVGFISEAQLQAGELGATKIIIAPATAYIMPETAVALEKFTAAGGTLIKIGECFIMDQYCRPLKTSVHGVSFPAEIVKRPEQLARELASIEEGKIGPLPVNVKAPGVEWRATPMADGATLVYLINLQEKSLPVKLSFNGKDLLSGKAYGSAFELAPQVPLLFKAQGKR